MKIEEQVITYEQAIRLKDLGIIALAYFMYICGR